MVINFGNFGGGGGSQSGYTLPIATSEILGGVMIGDGINVDSAGTISVSGSDVANYAMALKNGDYDDRRVVNEDGRLYYVEEYREAEENLFVKIKYDADYVYVDMDIDGQTDTDIVEISNGNFGFTISIDSEGNLYYVNEDDEDVYYNSEVREYQYGDFTFNWWNDGTIIGFPQQVNVIEVVCLTDNSDVLYCVGQEMNIANEDTLGLVKIGSGITLSEDGTISVEGGGGSGIEIVTELPESGTDGQTVILVENIPYKKIELTQSSQNITGITIGITSKTALYNYEWVGRRDYVYVNTDNSIEIQNDKTSETTVFSAGTVDGQYVIEYNGYTNTGTINVTDSGFTFVFQDNIAVENKIASVEVHQEEKEVLYTWSDNPLVMASVDYTVNSGANQNWLVRWKFSDIPNNTKLFVIKYNYGDVYRHFWYENGQINAYTTNSPSVETAATHFTVAQYQIQNVGVPSNVQDGSMYWSRMYWTDDEIIIYSTDANIRYWFNLDGIYRTGWHRETENKISNKVFYLDYIWYDGDYNPIIKNFDFPMYAVGLKINPTSNYNTPFTVYTKTNSTIGPIFAPTTTGTTGYVCVAGNGWAAPTWVSPETITNGVKFWKGTQDQYDALSGTTGYDASTMYIIIPD